MEDIYTRIRIRACQIVSRFPPPDFYQDHSDAKTLSNRLFETDPVVTALRAFVAANLEEDFGHGLEHAVKVALDAGALMIVEAPLCGISKKGVARRVVLAHCAGLLHDIRRKYQNHAIEGSDYARKVLKVYPLHPDEIEDVCGAILNHEAFKRVKEFDTIDGALVSNCLYDADKFRWGPDNFTHTLWAMVNYYKTSLADFMASYPSGLQSLEKIKGTFRSTTGKKYGPQFIDLGLAIGAELFEVLRRDFAGDS